MDPQAGAQPGKYLVDDSGTARYLIDPAINGRVEVRDDGTKVTKYDAPKARLMALIIDGIMQGKLPWGLVVLGVLIAVLMQLSFVPALAFAVGVYLPLAVSAPIFVGGMIRLAVDRIKRTPAEESDASPAVLLSSGYIAGGSIAGILIALLALTPGLANALDLSRSLPSSWTASNVPALGAFGVMVGGVVSVRHRRPVPGRRPARPGRGRDQASRGRPVTPRSLTTSPRDRPMLLRRRIVLGIATALMMTGGIVQADEGMWVFDSCR